MLVRHGYEARREPPRRLWALCRARYALRRCAMVSIPPCAVQSAPVSVQARFTGTRMDTAPFPAGSSVSSHRSERPSTRVASVTVAPLTIRAWSRMFSGVMSTSALNAIRNVNALDPSWLVGMSFQRRR